MTGASEGGADADADAPTSSSPSAPSRVELIESKNLMNDFTWLASSWANGPESGVLLCATVIDAADADADGWMDGWMMLDV